MDDGGLGADEKRVSRVAAAADPQQPASHNGKHRPAMHALIY